MARRKPHTEPNAEATVEVCRRATKGQGQGDPAGKDGDCVWTTCPTALQDSTAILIPFKAKHSLSQAPISRSGQRDCIRNLISSLTPLL